MKHIWGYAGNQRKDKAHLWIKDLPSKREPYVLVCCQASVCGSPYEAETNIRLCDECALYAIAHDIPIPGID